MLAEVHELRCCYEAGPCGYEVQRQLEQMGIECAVVDVLPENWTENDFRTSLG